MSETTSKPGGCRGCLRRGCCGCLVLLGLLVLVPVVAGLFFAALPEAPPDVVHDAAERSLPAPLAGDGTGAVPAPGTVVVDFEEGELFVQPGPAGSGLRVEADYDRSTHELVETFEAGGEDGGWIHRVTFRARHGALRRLFSRSASSPTVRIHVPRDRPVRIEMTASKGETRAELGGLALTGLDARFAMGDHGISFAEPVTAELDELVVRGRMGELRVEGLGNASPRRAVVAQTAGEVIASLDGAWRGTSDVRVDVAFGSGTVLLRGAPVAGGAAEGDAAPRLREDAVEGEGPAVVRLVTHADFGEMEERP